MTKTLAATDFDLDIDYLTDSLALDRPNSPRLKNYLHEFLLEAYGIRTSQIIPDLECFVNAQSNTYSYQGRSELNNIAGSIQLCPVRSRKAPDGSRKISVKPPDCNNLKFSECKNLYDSGAFPEVMADARVTPEASLTRQLHTLSQLPAFKETLLVSYDRLIDEKHVNGQRVKQRWTVQEGELAVKQTVEAAVYLHSQRSKLKNFTLVQSCQGVDAQQYLRCVDQVLPCCSSGDVVGLGGWCILGRQPSYLGTFWETINLVIPAIASAGITKIHIFGCTWYKPKKYNPLPPLPPLLWLCDQYGISLSTDGRSPIGNALWKDGWQKAGATFPYWRHNLAWVKAELATLRDSPYYQAPLGWIKPAMVMSTAIPEKFLEKGVKTSQIRSQGYLYQYIEDKITPDEAQVDYQVPINSSEPRRVTLSSTPEKFLENGLKTAQIESVGCLYPYLESKKLLDGSTVIYPRVIGERDPNNSKHWRWGFNWKEKHNGIWKGRSIGSIPPAAVTMIRAMQQSKATREDIVAFIKRTKTKKPSIKLDICNHQNVPTSKPVLPDNAPVAVVLFAGGGGIEAGMVQAGIRPVIAVEYDPNKPELSRAITQTHDRNFSEYGCKVIQQTVQEVAQSGFIGFPRRPDYLHASPVCANFSQAHTAKAGKGGETADDLTAALAVVESIVKLQPRIFTLENVPRYQESESFKLIFQALEQEGYVLDYSVVNMSDFGLPQARKRLVLIGGKGFAVLLPPHSKTYGWYSAIAHLIPTMPDSQLLPKQKQAVERFVATDEPAPLLIERVGGRKLPKYKPGHSPANTILRSHFTDHKGCNRNKFADIWLPDGTAKSLSIQGAAKLQGFPDWYKFPKETATAGSIIGYSVPPSFATQLFASVQSILQGAEV